MQIVSLAQCNICDEVIISALLKETTLPYRKAFNNIGIYVGKKIFIKDIRYNNKLMFIIINDVQYVIRTSDANFIMVEKN